MKETTSREAVSALTLDFCSLSPFCAQEKQMPLSDVLLMNDSVKEQKKKWMSVLLKKQMCNN